MPEGVFRWVITTGVFLAVIAFVVQTGLIFEVYRMAKITQDQARIDGAVDQTVRQLHQAGDVVKQTVRTPVRQVGGIVHGVDAALSVLSHVRRKCDQATEVEEILL
jgi:hypothetical protein